MATKRSIVDNATSGISAPTAGVEHWLYYPLTGTGLYLRCVSVSVATPVLSGCDLCGLEVDGWSPVRA